MEEPEPLSHVLYVIAFADGVVKVGISSSFKKRLRQHKNDARHEGTQAIDGWYSHRHTEADARRAEATLKKACAMNFPRARGAEYFTADFLSVLEIASDLNDALLLLSGRFDEEHPDLFKRH